MLFTGDRQGAQGPVAATWVRAGLSSVPSVRLRQEHRVIFSEFAGDGITLSELFPLQHLCPDPGRPLGNVKFD